MNAATWNAPILAASDTTIFLATNRYFSVDSLNKEYCKDSNTHPSSKWQGLCSYSIESDGK